MSKKKIYYDFKSKISMICRQYGISFIDSNELLSKDENINHGKNILEFTEKPDRETAKEFLKNNQLYEAKKIFTKVIKKDPNWAEAWNKRATVLYLLGDFKKSQKDIDKVLELEERHFGALAGQGLVNIHLKNYEKAINSYKKVQEIYPSMKSPEIMIKEIEMLIKKQLI